MSHVCPCEISHLLDHYEFQFLLDVLDTHYFGYFLPLPKKQVKPYSYAGDHLLKVSGFEPILTNRNISSLLRLCVSSVKNDEHLADCFEAILPYMDESTRYDLLYCMTRPFAVFPIPYLPPSLVG